MSDDHSLRAHFLLTATVRERMTYVNSRCQDLQRHLSSVKNSMNRLLDRHTDIYEVDDQFDKMFARMQFIQAECQALHELQLKIRG